MFSCRIRVKVSAVQGIRDPEGEEGYRIDFVEVRKKPPVTVMLPSGVPAEIGQIVTQISKGVQEAVPGGSIKEYTLPKLTLVLTAEELEAFGLKPYPNQIYELIITKGNISFNQVE